MSLSNYVDELGILLHDSSNLFTSIRAKVLWINQARRSAAKRTGCIQRLLTGQSAFGASAQPGFAVPGGMQPGALPNPFPAGAVQNAAANSFQTIIGQERYPYQGFANPYLRSEHAGCKSVIDVASVSVNWGGAVRPSLSWLAWEDLQAYARAYATLVESYAYYWSVLNDGENGEVWLFPCPSTANDMEWLVYATPGDLNTDDDYDAIPDGFKDAIKFGAASLCYQGQQRFQQAQLMDGLFAESLGIDRVAADRGKIPNFYASAL